MKYKVERPRRARRAVAAALPKVQSTKYQVPSTKYKVCFMKYKVETPRRAQCAAAAALPPLAARGAKKTVHTPFVLPRAPQSSATVYTYIYTCTYTYAYTYAYTCTDGAVLWPPDLPRGLGGDLGGELLATAHFHRLPMSGRSSSSLEARHSRPSALQYTVHSNVHCTQYYCITVFYCIQYTAILYSIFYSSIQ